MNKALRTELTSRKISMPSAMRASFMSQLLVSRIYRISLRNSMDGQWLS